MKHLSIAARILTPLAMVVFLSYELSQSLAVTGLWYVALLIGSVCTAVGIEIVGILAGHTLEGYWRIGDAWRGLLSFALLLAYTVTAVYILAGTSLIIVPIIAAIVYILASLTDGLETAVNRQEVATAVRQTFDLEQEARENDHRREMETRQAGLKAQNDLQIALAHDRTQAEIAIAEAKAQASIANAEARKVLALAKSEPAQEQIQPALAGYECEDCHKPFATVQALNAHGRFCVVRIKANGHAV